MGSVLSFFRGLNFTYNMHQKDSCPVQGYLLALKHISPCPASPSHNTWHSALISIRIQSIAYFGFLPVSTALGSNNKMCLAEVYFS